MKNFDKIYRTILTEGRIPSIFKKATPEEVAERAVQYEKIRIQEFLERKDVRRNKDGSYDVDGNVDFSELKTITKLPVRFRKVGRSFFCSDCTSLTTLEGAPNTVGWSFNCSGCTSLTSLEGAPTTVGGSFYCSGCTSLTSLEGAPTTFRGDFWCNDTNITSLKGAPKTVGGDFWCNRYTVKSDRRKFTKIEVLQHCDVRGVIYV